MESFYGGRRGESFVIVKHFDGIDIPAGTYKGNFYAKDEHNVLKLENGQPIPYTRENYNKYSWKYCYHDGSEVDGYTFPTEEAEGMVQCFSKGAQTTAEVNYGEYVIIDTWANMHNMNHPDNGCVFRRGMNLNGEYAGAEYIGKITGPKGDCPELAIDLESTVQQFDGFREEDSYEYSEANGGLVPGKYETEDGEKDFNDKISYSWVTLTDPYGNNKGCMIGFTFPYLVFDFSTQAVDPYDENGNYADMTRINRLDDKSHAFYEEWKFSIPKGVKGDKSTDFELVYYSVPQGTAALIDDNETTLPKNAILKDIVQYRSSLVGPDDYVEVLLWDDDQQDFIEDDEVYKVKLKNARTSLRYKETWYDEKQEGEYKYIVLGPYNIIENISMDNSGTATDGTIKIKYSFNDDFILGKLKWVYNIETDEFGITTITFNDATKKVFKEFPIKYIKDIKLTEDGDLDLTFNTLDKDGENEHYKTHLVWVRNITLTQDGKFDVYYNDGTKEDTQILNWIDQMNLEDDGTIQSFYNSDHEQPAAAQEKRIQWIDDAFVDDNKGLGSQRINIKYNTDDDYTEIGEPFNYILETTMTIGRDDCPGVDPYHLIVLYSDPTLRASIVAEGKNITYASRYPQTAEQEPTEDGLYIRDDWYDLGFVRGAKGGFQVLAEITDRQQLFDKNGVEIPPSALLHALEVGSSYVYQEGIQENHYYDGWGVVLKSKDTVTKEDISTFFFYDYNVKSWFKVNGGIGGGGAYPSQVIQVTAAAEEAEELEEDGYWFKLGTMKVAGI